VAGSAPSLRKPALSVVIPVYGRHGLARVALASVLAQDDVDLEVVLVLDEPVSSDGAASEWSWDPRVRVVAHGARRGAAAARNTGVAEARAEVVAFLDADDEWLPGAAELLSRGLLSLPKDAVGLTGSFVLVGEGGRESIRRPCMTGGAGGSYASVAVRGCSTAPGSTLAMRREQWLALGGEDELLERLEDWDLLLRVAERDWWIASTPDIVARVRHSSRGPSPDAVERSCQAILARHLPWVQSRSDVLARRLRATADYEVGLARLRHRRLAGSIFPLMKGVGGDPAARAPAAWRALERAALRYGRPWANARRVNAGDYAGFEDS
jgi:glycosyltransferase involved in cell wall biosynthesis